MSKPKVITVSQLSYLLKNVLEVEFPTVWVAGEVSNLSKPQSGHIYFTLKDDEDLDRKMHDFFLFCRSTTMFQCYCQGWAKLFVYLHFEPAKLVDKIHTKIKGSCFVIA